MYDLKRYEVTVTRTLTERWIVDASSYSQAKYDAVNRIGTLDANYEEIYSVKSVELDKSTDRRLGRP